MDIRIQPTWLLCFNFTSMYFCLFTFYVTKLDWYVIKFLNSFTCRKCRGIITHLHTDEDEGEGEESLTITYLARFININYLIIF